MTRIHRSVYSRLRRFGAAAFLAAIVVAGGRAQGGLLQELQKAVGKLPHSQARAGVCVIDLATGQMVFTLDADRPLTPASTMKLFAMSAALAELGPDFNFQTVLATDGRNLMVIGDGDPGFGDEKIQHAQGETRAAPFETWAEALRQRGIINVPGDLIIDEWVFADELTHPTWEKEDLGKWYAAPVAALNINDNCLDITVTPGGKGSSSTKVRVEPENSLLKIINNCRVGANGTPTLHHSPDTSEYTISGRTAKRWTFGPVASTDPALLFADSFRTVLARKGINVQGRIRRARVRTPDGALPPPITIVDVHRTPLRAVLTRAGKDSQNLFAECLLKRAGYARARRMGTGDARGSWELGAEAVLALLRRAGIDTNGLEVADGSGLSRDNACSARQLASLLAYEHFQPTGELLHESLATAGVDGSLRKRLKNSDGRVHAKTGTMHGVRTLAGYIDGDSGPRYAFAVMFNGYPGPSTPYKEIQDRVCRVLADACDSQSGGTR